MHLRLWGDGGHVAVSNGPGTHAGRVVATDAVVNLRGEATAIPSKHLVKCDLPELDFDLETQLPRRLEVQDRKDHNKWNKGTLEQFGADGRAFVRFDGEPERRYMDLTGEIYRWLVPGTEEVQAVVDLRG